MSADDSVTRWIAKLAMGDGDAAQAISDRYFERLAHFARQKLAKMPRRVADEEDAALSALHSLCRGAAAGKFPNLNDRDDLWRLMVTITARKVHAQVRRRKAKKRGEGKVRGESVFQLPGGDEDQLGIEQAIGREPTPEMANMVAEDCERLIKMLDDDATRQVALLKLEGYTVEEIAQRLDCVSRTVKRKLQAIRTIWSREFDQEETADARGKDDH